MPKNVTAPGIDNVNINLTPQGIQPQGYVPNTLLKKAATQFAFAVVDQIQKFSAYLDSVKNETVSVSDMR